MKRFTALILVLCMLAGISVSSADTGSFLEKLFSVSESLGFTASMQLDSLEPFTGDTVEMMNGVLGHLYLQGSLNETDIELSFLADQTEAAVFSEKTEGVITRMTTSLLPERTLLAASSPLSLLTAQEGTASEKFDVFTMMEEVRSVYSALAESIIPYAEEKKAAYKIKNIGSSKWVRIARLTPEQSAEIAPQISAVLACGMDDEFRNLVSGFRYSKAFVVALYRTEENGADLAVYMKGYVTDTENRAYSLSYQWASSEKGDVDTYKFELVRNKVPSMSRLLSATIRYSGTNNPSLYAEIDCTLKKDRSVDKELTEYQLSGTPAGNGVHVTGKISVERKSTGEDASPAEARLITPDLLLLKEASGTRVSGTCTVDISENKNSRLAFRLIFSEESILPEGDTQTADRIADAPSVSKPGSYEVGKAPIGYQEFRAQSRQIALENASTETKTALLQEMQQRLAGTLLQTLLLLPDKDTAFLRDNISEENYTMLLKWLTAE